MRRFNGRRTGHGDSLRCYQQPDAGVAAKKTRAIILLLRVHSPGDAAVIAQTSPATVAAKTGRSAPNWTINGLAGFKSRALAKARALQRCGLHRQCYHLSGTKADAMHALVAREYGTGAEEYFWRGRNRRGRPARQAGALDQVTGHSVT
jgi:hypothetical protein